MDIHHYDPETGEYLGTTEARLDPIDGEPLVPGYATDTAPPDPGSGQVAALRDGAGGVPAKGRDGSWTTLADHRGEPAHDAETHEPVEITELGPVPDGVVLGAPEDHRGETVYATGSAEPLEIEDYGPIPDGYTDLVPPDYPVWDSSAGAWNVDEAAALDGERAKALRRINAGCDAELAGIRDKYPASEMETWPAQHREAQAYDTAQQAGDPLPATPMLDGIAAARGITTADQVSRVLGAVDQYTSASSAAVGKRQKLEADVQAAFDAGDRAALEAVTWEGS